MKPFNINDLYPAGVTLYVDSMWGKVLCTGHDVHRYALLVQLHSHCISWGIPCLFFMLVSKNLIEIKFIYFNH